jgi:hypothetical protein
MIRIPLLHLQEVARLSIEAVSNGHIFSRLNLVRELLTPSGLSAISGVDSLLLRLGIQPPVDVLY